jgi:hypothetical protein
MRLLFAALPNPAGDGPQELYHLCGTEEQPAILVASACGLVARFPNWTGHTTVPRAALVCPACQRKSVGKALATIRAGLAPPKA